MQPIVNFVDRARQRINARIAILAVVSLIGGVAAWQGFRHIAATGKPPGPTKQIATGVPGGEGGSGVQTAGAELTDGQLPGAVGTVNTLGSAYGGNGGGGAAELNPYQVNPYAQGNGAEPAKPGTSPYGPQSATQVPANPYRASVGDVRQPAAPATSPYAANANAVTDSGAQGAQGAQGAPAQEGGAGAEAAQGADDPVAAYMRKFAGGGSSGSSGNSGSSATLAPVVTPATVKPEATPPAKPPTSLYGASTKLLEPSPATAPAAPADTPPAHALGGSASAAPGLNSYLSGSSRLGAGQPPHAPAESAAAGQSASATPGERQLEGPQQPAITIEKFAPTEIQVGKPATFEMVVRNAGQAPAHHVVVSDHVPAGTQLVSVKPQPAQAADGSLVWQLGAMQPGDETTITLQVMPQAEGEIGSTAQVTFAAQATSRSICTRPQLTIEHTAPPKVLIGEALTMAITVSNPGSGPATRVMIEEDVPAGLSHVAGSQLEYEAGTLRPGESKRLELALRAEKAGLIENTIVVRGEGNLLATHKLQIEVIAPQLQVEVNGPKKRFLQRQATYTVSVANPGTAPARDVELVAYLPRGMKFVEAQSQGQYDPAQHAVFWSLEELPPSKAGSVKLTTLPVEAGEQKLRIEGKADLGLAVAGEQIVQVEQSAELLHSVKDADDVIEVGSETTYTITVSNVGTKAATNVRVAALFPKELQGISGDGPSGRAGGDPTRVTFEPLAQLNPQEEVTFKVQAKGVAPGDHIVRVQLSSDQWPTPVTREESTRVYEDR